VPCLQLTLEGLVHDGMPKQEIVPFLDQLSLVTSIHTVTVACTRI
jgi:hypothetical protein